MKEDIVIPIKKREKEDIHMLFKLYKTYAVLEIYLDDSLILKKNMDVYDKNSFDMDLVIDLFNT